MRSVLILLLMVPLLAGAQQRNAAACRQQPVSQPARNLIFVVGDGMGVAQVYASMVARRADNSVFLRFPYTGFSRTYSHNRYTTDSGAGGTALMSGTKVENYHIAVRPDGSPAYSILSYAQRAGMSAGFVTTSSVLDATPASTYAHVSHRKQFDSISMQMARCGFDVMIGGGLNHFKADFRKDGNAPLDTLLLKGYAMAYSTRDLMGVSGRRICGLLYPEDPPKASERGRMLTLGALKAIASLNAGDKGFVLMIEGAQIDWACHRNDSAYLLEELADFEEMLDAVLDFAERDGNTLVVVTADHETGGLSLLDGNIAAGESKMAWATGGHSGLMVPVFAFGPGAEHFTGIMQNSDFFDKFVSLLPVRP